MSTRHWLRKPTLGMLIVLGTLAAGTARAGPDEILAAYAAKAGSSPSPERGRAFFTQKWKGNLFDSCADCHTAVPTARGRDQATDKTLLPLAPAANPKRFTDAARVENLLQLNCKDVLGRACTAQEKADVISWLISLKP